MIPNRQPGTSWFMRRDVGSYPNGYVHTLEGELVSVTYFERPGYAQSLILSRKDARLLAKRINQCLDGSVRK